MSDPVALFNGFLLARSESEFSAVSAESSSRVSRSCCLASLRNCLTQHTASARVALLVDVDAIDVIDCDASVHSVTLNNDADGEQSDTDVATPWSPTPDALSGDVEAVAWSADATTLVVLTTRSVGLFAAASLELSHAHSLYFHASDVACFDLRVPQCASDCACASVASGRDESTAAWASGIAVAVAGSDGLQLFHVCTRGTRTFSGRFVIVHEFLNIARVCVSRDAALLAVISAMGHVGIWRLAGDVGEQRSDNFWFHLVADCDRLIDVAFDSASSMLGVTSWDGALRVFERVPTARDCEWQQVVPDYLTYVDVKHQAGKIAAPLVALLDNGDALLSSGSTLVQINVRSAAPVALFQFECPVRGLVVAADNSWLCALADGALLRRRCASQ
jgi:hypothetical protein